MPSSSVRAFADPDDYAMAIRASTTEITITGQGIFSAKLIRVDLHRLWLQRLDDNLPRVAHTANVTGRGIVLFRTHPGPNLIRNGSNVYPTQLLQCSEGQTSFQRSSGGASWGSLSLPIEDLAAIGAGIAGYDALPPRYERAVRPAPAAMAKLRRLHAAAGYLAEHSPEVIANSASARGLEQELIEAVVACLAPADARPDRSASRRHDTIMKRFRSVLEAEPDRAIHLPELCAAIGASDRTLHACCKEYLGMSPLKYLALRRLHLARRALAMADAATTTVTDIATAHGFWELGRFAVAYRTLFGERPSVTLQRRPDALGDFPVRVHGPLFAGSA